MSLLKNEIKRIIDEPVVVKDNNLLKTNHSFSSTFNNPSQSKGEIISEIKNRINEFKHLKSSYQAEDLLNFDITREGLQQYFKDKSQSSKITENNINYIKENNSTKENKQHI